MRRQASPRKTLFATNVAYFPSVGGSEMVLQKILEGVRDLFDDVSVMVPLPDGQDYEVNGIRVLKYTRKRLWPLAVRERPTLYFPNMVHSSLTYRNIGFVSRFAGATVVNMVGGYEAGTSLAFRKRMLDNVARYADAAVHVDPLSSEYLIDRAINPNVPFRFITQGLDFSELNSARTAEPGPNPYFVFAHNLWHWKGVDVFFDQIVSALPDVQFVVIASDTCGDSIASAQEKAALLPNVALRLGLPRQEFLRTLAASSGVVSPSRIEGAQPNILLESGRLGVPYLSLCPGQNYGHYPHVEMFRSPEEIVQRIKDAQGALRQIKREALLRAQAQFSAPEYSWAAVIGQFRELFQSYL